MEKFYGEISKIKPEYLLKATPYTKETTINFCGRLTKDFFFSHLYAEKSKKPICDRENEEFDKRIEYELLDLENEFAKVSVYNITGYAGSGKTTYLHHLLWTKKDILGSYEVIDYEGSTRAVEPFVDRIANLIAQYDNVSELCCFFDSIGEQRLLSVFRFQEYLGLLLELSQRLKNVEKNEKQAYVVEVVGMEKNMPNEAYYLSFLLFIELMLLLFDRFIDQKKSPMILAIDNADSMSILSEEIILLPALKRFANDCTYFFASNLNNTLTFHGQEVKAVLNRTKLLMFITTRYVTIKRYESIEPDWEKVNGWISLKLPENYYDHKDIINKRIEYYQSVEDRDEKALNVLLRIRELGNIAYNNYNFMRLFNGNVRACFERLCYIVNEFSDSELREFLDLNSEYDNNNDVYEGVNGYFLYLILYAFKKGHIYEDKLGLSPCRKDGTISLSRIILTIIRENGNRYSIYRLFNSLVPLGYSAEEICNSVWRLCEAGRTVWRRLLIFDLVIPKSLGDLNRQAALFSLGETSIERYSELVICTAGLAYMEFVVPHFEFMLSRHEMAEPFERSVKYQPLFSRSSEEVLGTDNDETVYRFEKKIDFVFNDVRDCCYNSIKFANKVMTTYSLTRSEYISSTSYNYHTIGWEGEVGPKQSYESRLIFRHIGYIEKYRCYLIKKYKNIRPDFCIEINRRLVERIKRYLDLYKDQTSCFQTEIQNKAAEDLCALVQIIENSKYRDLSTRIEKKKNPH